MYQLGLVCLLSFEKAQHCSECTLQQAKSGVSQPSARATAHSRPQAVGWLLTFKRGCTQDSIPVGTVMTSRVLTCHTRQQMICMQSPATVLRNDFDAGWKSYSSLLYAAAADTYSLPAMMSLSQLLTMYMSVAVNPNVRKRKLNLHAQAARQCKCLPTAPGQDWANNCLAHPAPWAHFRHPPANGPRPPVSPCHGANAQSGCL